MVIHRNRHAGISQASPEQRRLRRHSGLALAIALLHGTARSAWGLG